MIRRMRSSCGVTVIELLVGLCIIALLTVLTLQNLPAWISSTQLSKDRNSFAALIYTARAAAINLNHQVILCPGTTSRGCAKRDSWQQGAIAFADSNRNRQYDNDDPFVAGFGSIDSQIEWRSFRNRSYLKFLPSGRTDWQNGHFKFCGNSEKGLQLVLNRAGRLYFSHDEDGDGWHEDVRGRDLIC